MNLAITMSAAEVFDLNINLFALIYSLLCKIFHGFDLDMESPRELEGQSSLQVSHKIRILSF